MVDELINHLSGFVTEQRLIKFDSILDKRSRYISLVLENLYQEHNSSALLRTCDCFGVQDVYIIEDRNKFEVNNEIALGSDKWLTINRESCQKGKPTKLLKNLRKKGYRIIATSPPPKGVPLSEFDIEKGPVALLFGTEKEGLSEELMKEADEYLSIEMFGFTESFNVSVSAGIILHKLRELLINSTINWKIDEEERKLLKLNWLRNSIKSADLIEQAYLNNQGD